MDALPSYKKPPVVETVLGVQFDPLPKLRNAHLGLFWRDLGEGWPVVEEHPPLDPQFEEFPESWAPMGVRFKLTQNPACRLRIKNSAGDRMIQVQNGRFHLNWLGGGTYPRYGAVRRDFDDTLKRFERFIESEDLGELVLNQWEVTYVNHIPTGELWSHPREWVEVFPGIGGGNVGLSMVELEAVAVSRRFEIKPEQGRLHIEINTGRTRPANQDVLIARLTARGAVSDDGGQGYGAGLDLGRECIVRTFTEITSDKAHKQWERER